MLIFKEQRFFNSLHLKPFRPMSLWLTVRALWRRKGRSHVMQGSFCPTQLWVYKCYFILSEIVKENTDLQVEYPWSHVRLVLHISVLKLLKNGVFNEFCQLLWRLNDSIWQILALVFQSLCEHLAAAQTDIICGRLRPKRVSKKKKKLVEKVRKKSYWSQLPFLNRKTNSMLHPFHVSRSCWVELSWAAELSNIMETTTPTWTVTFH